VALRLDGRTPTTLPQRFAADDVRFPEPLVDILVKRLTDPGDVVLDPFAGFGTTPAVAERLGREGWGVELDGARAAYIRTRVRRRERIFATDARTLPTLPIPPAALVLTSPPYSAPGDPCDALAAYRGATPGYAAYLRGIQEVFRGVAALLQPDGWAVIEAASLHPARREVTLPRDIARVVGEILPFAGELAIDWHPPRADGTGRSSCLLFGSIGRDNGQLAGPAAMDERVSGAGPEP
jgi:SAM-dependent methyltransferase